MAADGTHASARAVSATRPWIHLARDTARTGAAFDASSTVTIATVAVGRYDKPVPPRGSHTRMNAAATTSKATQNGGYQLRTGVVTTRGWCTKSHIAWAA